ncbi:hypothetical protein [Pectobacterium parvum]|uniref:Uncharacterized protein n=1 Tax=Pectobacterium parvum TaxID=2778550 RepID=A0AAP9IEQ3_9GAMM|nr:hypothetical protein [Pectobacterium parvum]QHQ23006.1 hypothetical protein GMX10_02180 [Pectobacterium parvum]
MGLNAGIAEICCQHLSDELVPEGELAGVLAETFMISSHKAQDQSVMTSFPFYDVTDIFRLLMNSAISSCNETTISCIAKKGL